MKDTYWVRVPCTTNVEGNKGERAQRTEGRSLRRREKGSTRGREAGAEIEKALDCCFLLLINQWKTCTQQRDFFHLIPFKVYWSIKDNFIREET